MTKYQTWGIGILFAAVLLALGACGGGNPADADLLKRAVANMKTAQSYQVDVVMSVGGQVGKMNNEIDLAGNRARVRMVLSDTDLLSIWIGNTSYDSFDGGKTFIDGTGGVSTYWRSWRDMWQPL